MRSLGTTAPRSSGSASRRSARSSAGRRRGPSRWSSPSAGQLRSTRQRRRRRMPHWLRPRAASTQPK
eukprot:1114264-Pyramimonas_sp.AAC.1